MPNYIDYSVQNLNPAITSYMILCHVSRCFIIRSNELHLRIRRLISSFPTLRLGFSTDAASYLAFAEPDDLQRKAMKVSHLNERALVGRRGIVSIDFLRSCSRLY